MPELILSSVIEDVVLVRPDVHGDERGRFVETYRRSWFPDGREMVQGNRSEKQAGALVGLHFHLHQADYWYALRGRARVVLHDLRVGSRTDGATELIDLDGDVDQGIYIPPGVAHGFAALSDILLTYLVDNYYDASDEHGLAWDDTTVGADWGISDPILSKRDRPTRGAATSPTTSDPAWPTDGARRQGPDRRRQPRPTIRPTAGERPCEGAALRAPRILLNMGRC